MFGPLPIKLFHITARREIGNVSRFIAVGYRSRNRYRNRPDQDLLQANVHIDHRAHFTRAA
jgi:hypothetical protein